MTLAVRNVEPRRSHRASSSGPFSPLQRDGPGCVDHVGRANDEDRCAFPVVLSRCGQAVDRVANGIGERRHGEDEGPDPSSVVPVPATSPACRRMTLVVGPLAWRQPYALVVDATWPRPLVSGDRVALVSPAGPPDPDRVARGIELLEGWGLHVSHEAGERDGFLAASDRDRMRSVQRAFDDPEVRAVLCTRGGYGSQRIVDDLNVDGFVARRAAFVGFSDTTALHAKLNQAGLATFYGPPARVGRPTQRRCSRSKASRMRCSHTRQRPWRRTQKKPASP